MREEYRNKFRERWEERKERWEKRMEHRSNHGHIWTGVFILLVGIAALVKATVTDLPTWMFSWQMFLWRISLYRNIPRY